MFKCADINSGVLLQSPFTGRKLKLLAREKKIILDTWANVPDKEAACQSIFALIFRKKPSLQRLWGFENVPEAELTTHKTFLLHATSFFKFLDVAVRSVNLEGDYLVMCARNVGIRHCYFREVSFDAENWLLFKNSAIECLAPHGHGIPLQHLKDTWNLFLAFIITEMKDAFYKETHKKNTRPSIIFNHPEEQSLLKELQDKYELCKAEDEEIQESQHDVLL